MTITTSCGLRLVPLSIASTAAGVGGMTGIPSLQSRSSRNRLTASRPSGDSSSSTVNISVPWFPFLALCRGAGNAVRLVNPRMMSSICSSTILQM